jgi:hypothetical protein
MLSKRPDNQEQRTRRAQFASLGASYSVEGRRVTSEASWRRVGGESEASWWRVGGESVVSSSLGISAGAGLRGGPRIVGARACAIRHRFRCNLDNRKRFDDQPVRIGILARTRGCKYREARTRVTAS